MKLKKKKKNYKMDKEPFPSIFKDNEQRNNLFLHLPLLKLKKIKKNPKVLLNISGPNQPIKNNDELLSFAYGRSISTYPHIPGKEQRDGEPICDSFCVNLLEDSASICVIADGCNWGRRPMEASNAAKDAFIEYMRAKLSEISDLRDAGHYLIQSLSYCHYKICEGKEDKWEAGTTTLLGGITLKIKEEKIVKEQTNLNTREKWVWVGVSIGDCKCFYYSPNSGTILDLTEGNRKNVNDPKDCGGRLGPYVGDAEPDLRNLCIHYQLCEEGDLILLLSDGVHDNLDPQTLGKLPKDIGPEWEHISDWNSFSSDEEIQKAKTQYMLKLLANDLILGREEQKNLRMKVFSVTSSENEFPFSPSYISNRILRHCLYCTGRGREWMEQNPKEKLPNDYVEFPGKMDHATCAILKIGNYEINN